MSSDYNLYAKGHSLISIIPNGPLFGKLTITDEIDRKVLPHPLQKCILELYDEEALAYFGDSRDTFWIDLDNNPLATALRHLNGQV